tara:strand:- start:1280 stop:1717 length:438 start_codon:yes stop_codon:yes gene_type:complete
MKPTKQNFFAELKKAKSKTNLKSHKVHLAVNDDASQIMDELGVFRQDVGGVFQEANNVYDAAAEVRGMYGDLKKKGDEMLNRYYSLVSEADTLMITIEEQARELGIDVSAIPYYQELQNNLNDTKEDEDGLVNAVRDWESKRLPF